MASPAAAQALQTGGSRAAQTMLPANMLNPTANFFQGMGTNQNLMSALGDAAQGLFSRSGFSQTQLRPETAPVGFPSTYVTGNPRAANQGYGYY
jgi:hypothetical protein